MSRRIGWTLALGGLFVVVFVLQADGQQPRAMTVGMVLMLIGFLAVLDKKSGGRF